MPNLVRLLLFARIDDAAYTPRDFTECVGLPEMEETEDGEWFSLFRLREPEGEGDIFIHRCEEREDHTHHATMELRLGADEAEEPDVPDVTWDEAIRCFVAVQPRAGDLFLSTAVQYDPASYRTIIDDVQAFAGGAVQEGVRLTGMNFDFSDSPASLMYLRLSQDEETITSVIGMTRNYEPEDGLLDKITQAAVELGRLVVHEREVSETKTVAGA